MRNMNKKLTQQLHGLGARQQRLEEENSIRTPFHDFCTTLWLRQKALEKPTPLMHLRMICQKKNGDFP